MKPYTAIVLIKYIYQNNINFCIKPKQNKLSLATTTTTKHGALLVILNKLKLINHLVKIKNTQNYRHPQKLFFSDHLKIKKFSWLHMVFSFASSNWSTLNISGNHPGHPEYHRATQKPERTWHSLILQVCIQCIH